MLSSSDTSALYAVQEYLTVLKLHIFLTPGVNAPNAAVGLRLPEGADRAAVANASMTGPTLPRAPLGIGHPPCRRNQVHIAFASCERDRDMSITEDVAHAGSPVDPATCKLRPA